MLIFHSIFIFPYILFTGINSRKVSTELRHAFMRLNGIIAGMSILTTASTSVPMKIPVKIRLSGIMTRVISTEPTASPAAMPFLPPIFLYIRPDASTSTPDAQKCIRKPIMWLDELTVNAWIAEVMSRITSPADGPNSIVPMSTGTSAMSSMTLSTVSSSISKPRSKSLPSMTRTIFRASI